MAALFLFLTEKRKEVKKRMTIDELREALDRIPKTGAINRARRLQIQKQIFELMQKGESE